MEGLGRVCVCIAISHPLWFSGGNGLNQWARSVPVIGGAALESLFVTREPILHVDPDVMAIEEINNH